MIHPDKYRYRSLNELIINPYKLSSSAISFEFVNRPEYRLIVPGSKTRSTVNSFILFENEQSMLEELPNYGNRFIVDKYSHIFYELFDYLIEESSFLNTLSELKEVPLSYTESYMALAIQKPYGLQALTSTPHQQVLTVGHKQFAGKEVDVDAAKVHRTTFDFLFKCETTKMLTYELEEGEKLFSLESVLESCAYQLMYISNECALGCAFCQKGVGYDNP